MSHHNPFLLLACAGLLTPAAPLPASDDPLCMNAQARGDDKPGRAIPGFDAASGRDTRRFAPDRVVDFTHMRLDLDIPDMNRPHLSAVQTLTLTPISARVPELTLDAHLLDIKSVRCEGHTTKFETDGSTLTVTFDPPLAAGTETTLLTSYNVDDPPQGLLWTLESPAWPGRPAQIHTQGEAQSNSYWFPCHDFPNERLTTELIVTVPDGYVVSANGRLVNDTKPGSSKGRVAFHWLQDKPHVNYLVSMVVGKFDIVDAGGSKKLPLPVYVPPGRGRDVPRTYGHTPQMIELFNRLTGRDYPWDRYAQVVVWNFGAGGMENTSATTMYDTAVLSPAGLVDGDLDGLISHELAHQWFGDLITCKSWDHIWLNEGFATYFTHLWMEQRAGHFGTSNDEYLAGILGNFDTVCQHDKCEAPYIAPLVSKAYSDPGESFGRAGNPYPKGASILHMLRMRLGDEAFFRAIATYVNRYQLKTAETGDFRRVMEEASGDSLEQFFQQWCFRPGTPDLAVETSWSDSDHALTVTCDQKQHIDGANPAFSFNLPIWIAAGQAGSRSAGAATLGRGRFLTLPVIGKSASMKFRLDHEPPMVVIDPQLAVLAHTVINQPEAAWIAQLEGGPTFAARAAAARALETGDSPAARDALVRTARDDSLHARLRAIAIETLAKRHDAPTLLALAQGVTLPPDTRVTLAESLASAGKEKASPRDRLGEALARLASADASPRTRAAALRGLGAMKATGKLKVLIDAADVDSQHDRVRQGALEALGDMDAREGLPVVLRYAAPGAYNRTRPIAIAAIAKLAHHDPEAAYAALSGLLADRERRAWDSAGEALVKLGDARAAEAFTRLSESKRDPADRKRIAGWASALTKSPPQDRPAP